MSKSNIPTTSAKTGVGKKTGKGQNARTDFAMRHFVVESVEIPAALESIEDAENPTFLPVFERKTDPSIKIRIRRGLTVDQKTMLRMTRRMPTVTDPDRQAEVRFYEATRRDAGGVRMHFEVENAQIVISMLLAKIPTDVPSVGERTNPAYCPVFDRLASHSEQFENSNDSLLLPIRIRTGYFDGLEELLKTFAEHVKFNRLRPKIREFYDSGLQFRCLWTEAANCNYEMGMEVWKGIHFVQMNASIEGLSGFNCYRIKLEYPESGPKLSQNEMKKLNFKEEQQIRIIWPANPTYGIRTGDIKATISAKDEQIMETSDIFISAVICLPDDLHSSFLRAVKHCKFDIEPVFSKTIRQRYKAAAKKVDTVDQHLTLSRLHRTLVFGDETLDHHREPETVKYHNEYLDKVPLDPSQREAIELVLGKEVTVVQGPPGTGKSYTALRAVAAYLHGHQSLTSSGRVLITAPSNTAVNKLLKDWIKLCADDPYLGKFEAVRYIGDGVHPKKPIKKEHRSGNNTESASSTESSEYEWQDMEHGNTERDHAIRRVKESELPVSEDPLEDLYENTPTEDSEDEYRPQDEVGIEDLVMELEASKKADFPYEYSIMAKRLKIDPTFEEDIQSYLSGNMSDDDRHFFHIRKDLLDVEVMRTIQIVFATCLGAGSSTIRFRFQPKLAVIDEAGQANEIESFVPLTGPLLEQIALFGDHKQLPPINVYDILVLTQSLLERLQILMKGPAYVMLLHNYRSNPDIVNFSSLRWYNNRLIPNRTYDLALDTCSQLWNDKRSSLLGLSTFGSETETPSQSRQNLSGAIGILWLLRLVERRNPEELQNWAVICMYSAQVGLVRELLSSFLLSGLTKVRVGTVDGFQGDESDYVIVDLVRSNEDRMIGFLKSENRLNVASTRGRKRIIYCADFEMLGKDKVFGNFVESEPLFALSRLIPYERRMQVPVQFEEDVLKALARKESGLQTRGSGLPEEIQPKVWRTRSAPELRVLPYIYALQSGSNKP
ncbi:hypothetical protein TWF694_008900 [Orbilia ellipsospora]|uniref:Helicase ATP-binding domain-containing protein n=1 Tax=Orbilia ellipsospora TaxID=2528407 RepID=A0AAV9XD98_9PEZI